MDFYDQLDVLRSRSKHDSIEDFVQAALRVPFRARGRDFFGWDCYGVVYQAHLCCAGVILPRYSDLYDDADVRGTADLAAVVTTSLAASWSRVPLCDARPLDVAVLNILGRPVHVGLMIDGRRMLHAEEKIGTVIEPLSTRMWATRLAGVYRYEK